MSNVSKKPQQRRYRKRKADLEEAEDAQLEAIPRVEEDNSTSDRLPQADDDAVMREREQLMMYPAAAAEEPNLEQDIQQSSFLNIETADAVDEDDDDEEGLKALMENAKNLLPTAKHKITSGVGYSLLRKMGWDQDKGIGARMGRAEPIPVILKRDGFGLGYTQGMEDERTQQAIRALQEERRKKAEEKKALELAKEDAKLQEERDRERLEKLKKNPPKINLADISYENLVKTGAISVPESNDPYNHKPDLSLLNANAADEIEADGAVMSATLRERKKPKGKGDCQYCNQSFPSKISLRAHVRQKHSKLVKEMKSVKREGFKGNRRQQNERKKGLRGMIERQELSYDG
mmetsp:Transcript_27965/g.45389  ORF Transcript_27965/g.45389 Transcript_27965/m.45389 type:complete len:348 (-) Transcript_27965:46-1089(-)